MLKKLEGKIAVITGGTEGIGLAAAKLFVKEGAYVFITGRRQKELDEAVEAIGGNVSGVQGDISKLLNINVRGTLFTVQKALPLLNDGGSIILNGSVASVKGTAAFGIYAASKAAIRSFVRTWTTDLKDRRIRSNVVS